jgi:ribosome maturation factor RimP
MDNGSVTERVRQIAERVAADQQVELVQVQIAGTKREMVVRIFIDKEGGVTLEDCSRFSRDVEGVLDVEDPIPARYVLEVSSPGIERELYSVIDFEKFTGQLARVKLKTEQDGQKNFVGRIVGVEGTTIKLDDRTSGPVSFDHSKVAKANLKIDLSQELAAKRQ